MIRVINKFILVFNLFFACTMSVFAQQVTTSYFLKDGKPHDKIEGSYYYRNIYLDTTINKTKVFGVEEYYTADNAARMIGYSTVDKSPLKFIGELKCFYPNRNIESYEKFNISGVQIDTAYYFYPNKALKMLIYRDGKEANNLVSNKSTSYIACYDSLQKPLVMNGNGFVRLDLDNGLMAEDSLNYEEGTLSNNKKTGQWIGVKGKYRFKENYTNGLLMDGTCYCPDGTLVSYTENTVRKEPEYPGGLEGLAKYIKQSFTYPEEAKRNKVRGTVIVNFLVDELGKIQNIRVTKDLGYGMREEAYRLVQQMGKWIPGSYRGIPTKVSFTLPINMNLYES